MTTHRRILPAVLLALLTFVAACDQDNAVQPQLASATVSSPSLDFGSLDLNLGASLAQSVTVTNTGDRPVALGPLRLDGGAAGDFTLLNGGWTGTLGAGQAVELGLRFNPSEAGPRDAELLISTNADEVGTLTVALAGAGEASRYRQVDRIGIPALNTVFNHPPAFSKTDYNTASPRDDVASYTGLFETVLGAVANPDPQATAALLLPDELPVSLGTSVTSFATLTGRAPADDAVDVALSVVVGIDALKSDNVDANDRAFPSSFPYLPGPN